MGEFVMGEFGAAPQGIIHENVFEGHREVCCLITTGFEDDVDPAWRQRAVFTSKPRACQSYASQQGVLCDDFVQQDRFR